MEQNIIRNTRYFKYNGDSDDDLEVVKVLKYQNIKTLKCEVSYKGKTEQRKITIEELKANYTKLEYDGIISLSVVHLDKIDDVMVLFMRRKDLEKGNGIPYAVCRQCVSDIFHYAFAKEDKDYFGLSINVDSCPANINFANFLACNALDNQMNIAYYIGDKLDDLLNMVDLTPYDEVLEKLFKDRCHYMANGIRFIENEYLQKDIIDGYVKSLKELLSTNNFYNDIYNAFNIYPLAFDMQHSAETQILDATIKDALSFLLSQNVNNTIVLKYNKDIDLDEMQHRLYVLVADEHEDIYFIAYDTIGEYHVPVETVESADNINTLHTIIPGAKSVNDAYHYIRLNTNKYN